MRSEELLEVLSHSAGLCGRAIATRERLKSENTGPPAIGSAYVEHSRSSVLPGSAGVVLTPLRRLSVADPVAYRPHGSSLPPCLEGETRSGIEVSNTDTVDSSARSGMGGERSWLYLNAQSRRA